MELARLYMSEMRFDDAIAYFEKSKALGYPFDEREEQLLESSRIMKEFVDSQPANMSKKKIHKLTELIPYEHIISYASLRYNLGDNTLFAKHRFVTKALATMNEIDVHESLVELDDQTFSADFSSTAIKRLSPLTGFPLSEIKLKNTQSFTSASFVAAHSKVDISDTLVNDISPLLPYWCYRTQNEKTLFLICDFRKMPDLKHLDIQSSQINEKHFLSKLPRLEELNIAFSNIENL